MKKFLSFLSVLACAICLCVGLAGCTPKTVGIEIRENTIPQDIYVGETVDWSDLEILVKYDNKKTASVFYNSSMTVELDNSSAGEKTLTVTYMKHTATATVTVKENRGGQAEFRAFEKPALATAFDTNSTSNIFKEKGKSYKVGNNNAFIFKPQITMKVGEDYTHPDSIPTTFKLYSYAGSRTSGGYQEVTGDELANTVTFDNQTYAIKFASGVTGTFKLEMYPTEHPEADNHIEFVVEVVDGYNINKLTDLAIVNNVPKAKEIWAEIANANGVDLNTNVNAVILHNSFNITNDDIPRGYKWNREDADFNSSVAGLEGTLRANRSLYTHVIAEGETFTIYGNYFTLNASGISLTVKDLADEKTPFSTWNGGKVKNSHSAIFEFGDGDNFAVDGMPASKQGNVVVQDLNSLGNANKSSNTDCAGGFYFVKEATNESTYDNVVLSSFLKAINNIGHDYDTIVSEKLTIKNCDFKDTFAEMFNIWGGAKLIEVEESSLKNAGGPIFIVNQMSNYYTDIILKNSEVESFITGQEAFFVYNNLNSIATDLMALDGVINQTSAGLRNNANLQAMGVNFDHKTFVNPKVGDNQNKANAICIFCLPDSVHADPQQPIKGKLTVKNSNDQTTFEFDMENNIINSVVTQKPVAKALPFFYAGGSTATVTVNQSMQPNGLAQLYPEKLADMGTSATTESCFADAGYVQYLKNFFSGDYFGIYASGARQMGIVAEYFTVNN